MFKDLGTCTSSSYSTTNIFGSPDGTGSILQVAGGSKDCLLARF